MDQLLRNTTHPTKVDLRELDFFSEGIKVNVKGKDKVPNLLGTFTTIMLYSVLCWTCWYFISGFLDTTEPKIQYKETISPKGNEVVLSEVRANFFILVENPKFSVEEKKAATAITAIVDDRDSQEGKTFSDVSRIKSYGVGEPYLTLKSLGTFYGYHFNYVNKTYSDQVGADSAPQWEYDEQDLVECSQTDWFKDPIMEEVLKKDMNTYEIIKKYGICLDMSDEKGPIYIKGDSTSTNYSYASLELTECFAKEVNSPCDPKAKEIIKNSKRRKLIFGYIEPVLDKSDIDNPFKWYPSLDNQFNINPELEVMTTVFLKNITVETDRGLIVESTSEDSQVAIHSINMFVDDAELISPILLANSDSQETESSNYAAYISVRIEAGSLTENYSRSYDKILDLFGSIGGTIDAFILMFIIFFHWYQNYVTSLRMKRALGNHLGVPTKMKVRGNSIFNMCLKRNSDEKIEALDEMVEETTSFQKLSENLISVSLLNKYIFDPNAKRLAPTIRLMKKMIDMKEEELRNEPHHENSNTDDSQAKNSELDSMRDVYNMIQAIPDDSTMNRRLKKTYLGIFEAFKKQFQKDSVDGIFSGESFPVQGTTFSRPNGLISPQPGQARLPPVRSAYY